MSSVAKSTKVYSGFAPTQIPGCALWLDAADPSSLTLSGNKVSSWRDKSGNGYNATQSSSANQPTYTGSNIQFIPASLNWMDLNQTFGNLFLNNAAFHVFIVAFGGGSGFITGQVTNTSQNLFLGYGFMDTYQSPWYLMGSPPVSDSVNSINGFEYTGSTGRLYQNGSNFASVTAALPLTAFTGPQIGRRYSGGAVVYHAHTFCEIVAYVGTTLTTAQRQQVEGYLAQKWGLASVMPATHPFGLSIAPSPQSFSPRDIDGCKVWLDAADTTTITVSGSNVSAWRDKASGLTFSNSGTVTYTESSKTMNFTGSNILTNATGVSTSVGVNQFVVWSSPVGATRQRIFQQTYTGQYAFGIIDTNFIQNLYSASVGYYVGPLTYSASTPYLYSVNTRSGTGLTYSVNGVESSAWTSAYTPGLQSTSLFVGGSSLFPFTGSVMEVLHYDAFLTVAQTQQIEGYLAWKWGLVPNIPAPHPYKLALPYVRQFSPRDVAGCALWLDAADSNSLTLSGSSVTAWADKSGNGRNATGGVSPSYSNNGVVFNGTNTYLSTTYSAVPSAESVFVAVTWTGSADRNYCIIGTSATNGRNYNVFKNAGSNTIKWDKWGVAGYAETPGVQSNVQFLSAGVFNGTSGSTNLNGGSQTGLISFSFSGAGLTNIGAGVLSDYYQGTINEIVIYNTALTATQRQQVEGYLAWKWNLASNLPAAHPFEDKPPYAQPFLPTNVPGCSLWLDAADTGSVIRSGSSVTQWRDKSGNGKNATTSANFPTYSTNSLNGKATVRFAGASGTANFLDIPAFDFGTSQRSIFFVIQNTGPSSGAGSAPHWFWPLTGNSTNALSLTGWTYVDLQAQSRLLSYTPAKNAYIIVSIQFGSTSGVGQVFTNGISEGTITKTVGGTSFANATSGYRLGWLTGSTAIEYSFDGNIAEMILFNTAVSTTQRQQIEGYLAWKWGLTSFLSVLHPFKYSAPSYYIPPFTPTDLAGCALWLDATDSTSLTLSGSSVTAWRDKSANGYSFTGTAGNYPVVSNSSINGLSTLSFTGTGSTSQYLSCLPFVLSNVNYSIFTVVRQNATAPSTYGFNYVLALPVANARLAFGSLDYKFSTFTGSGTTWNGVTSNSPDVFVTSKTLILGMIVDGSVLTPYYNGIAMNTKVGTTGSFTGLRVGDSIDGFTGQCWGGLIAEIIIYNTALTTTQRQMVENYLAWKWGLNQSLVARPNVRPLPLYTRPINPLDIAGCQLWLDAADATSLTLSGSNVTAWRDKSPSSLALTLTGTPTWTANSVNFTGTQYFTNSTISLNLSAMTLFLVGHTLSGSQNGGFMSFVPIPNGTDYSQTNAIAYTAYSNVVGTVQTVFNYPATSIFPTYTSPTNPFLFTHVQSGTAMTLYGLGTSFYTTTTNFTPGTTTGLTIGARYQNGNGVVSAYLTGNVKEIIAYNAALTTTQRQQIEGYLAWKWGLIPNIPAPHPFKRFPSLMTTFAPPQLSGLSLWFDAADPTVVTSNASSVVTGVRDKSGGGFNLTNALTTTGFTWNQTKFNGSYPSFYYNGTQDVTLGSNSSFSINQPATVFVVAQRVGTGANQDTFDSTSSTNRIFAFYSGGAFNSYFIYAGVTLSQTGNMNSNGGVYSHIFNSTSSAIYENGALIALGNAGTLNGTGVTIGSRFTQNTETWQGHICEVIYYAGLLTTTQRQQVEGYLAWKWGLVGNLPSTHPYKKFTP